MTASNSYSTASSLFRAAVNATNAGSDSDDDFESLLKSTRRAFRPDSNRLTNGQTKGRKKNKQTKRTVVLLRRSTADFFPSTSELQFLTDIGLGKIFCQYPLIIRR